VGIWCVGEYGDLLMTPYSYTREVGGITAAVSFEATDPASILETVEEVIARHTCSEEVKEHALTAFTKLCERFAETGDSETLARLQELVKKNTKSHALELQLRSCEYDALINAMKGIKVNNGAGAVENDIFGAGGSSTGLSAGVIAAAKEALARMPVVDISVMQKQRTSEYGGGKDDDTVGGLDTKAATPANNDEGGDLLDLEDIFGGGAAAPTPAAKVASSENNVAPGAPASTPAPSTDLDLLSDIFSAPAAPALVLPSASTSDMNSIGVNGSYDPFGSVPSSQLPQQLVTPLDAFAPVSTPAPVPVPSMNGSTPAMGDIFGAPAVVTAPPQNTPVIVPGCSYQGLAIEFECTKPEPMIKQKSALVAKFKNANSAPLYGLSLQCAVPKYVTMEMKPPTSTTIPASGGSNKTEVTQTITVTNNKMGEKNLMLKLKLGFTLNGTKVDHMATVSGFPAGEY